MCRVRELKNRQKCIDKICCRTNWIKKIELSKKNVNTWQTLINKKDERFEIRQILSCFAIIHNICKFNAFYNNIKRKSFFFIISSFHSIIINDTHWNVNKLKVLKLLNKWILNLRRIFLKTTNSIYFIRIKIVSSTFLNVSN